LPDELMNYYNQVTQALVGPCIVLVKVSQFVFREREKSLKQE